MRYKRKFHDKVDSFIQLLLSIHPQYHNDVHSIIGLALEDETEITRLESVEDELRDDRERIVCSAIWYKSGDKLVHSPTNIPYGYVICALRHCNCFALSEVMFTANYEYIEGFLTSKNRFVDRKEALLIWKTYNHTEPIMKNDELDSSDLY